ncbi:tetratricopeptide repeat protein [Massilia rubra]|uniref:Sel1 repeat family protein n=1 Tax=Massilia rubra TaxID=2607910 RepID=A0ABX0LUE9_9BURK|nr:sel1 repeat family protein [Massilia rubra]NHZ36363.1 sel1 repeat family protein [Massilia rubra]
MTIHYNPMKCTGCAQEFAFPSIGRSYTDLPEAGGRHAAHFSAMLLQQAWCHECEGASWVERIPGEREFATAAGLRRRADRSGYEGIDDDLLEIEDDDFRWLYEHLPHRKAPPRCLVCASTHFTPIDATQRQTPIVHEACWDSPIEFRGFSIGSGGLQTGGRSYAHRFYDAEGDVVWAKLCMQEFLVGRLIVILHARRHDPAHATLAAAIDLVINRASDDALAVLAPLAAANNPAALGLLGALHYVGEGVAHSGTEAVSLLEKAKALGDACAAHNLASLYATGAAGVAKDIARARQLFAEARAMGGQYERDDFYAHDNFTVANRTFYHPI